MACSVAPNIDAGGDAYSRGETRATCPFSQGSEEANDWRFGWKLRATLDVQILEELARSMAAKKLTAA